MLICGDLEGTEQAVHEVGPGSWGQPIPCCPLLSLGRCCWAGTKVLFSVLSSQLLKYKMSKKKPPQTKSHI